jgi:hypothetical protein
MAITGFSLTKSTGKDGKISLTGCAGKKILPHRTELLKNLLENFEVSKARIDEAFFNFNTADHTNNSTLEQLQLELDLYNESRYMEAF